MATHSSILARKIPWTEELGRLKSIGSHRIGHDRATEHSNANLYHHQLAESVLVSARPRAWNFVQTASAVCLPGGDPHPEPACPVRRGQNLDVTSSSEEMTHQAVSLAPEPPCFFLSSSALRAECQLAFQPSAWPLRPVLLARKLKNENL